MRPMTAASSVRLPALAASAIDVRRRGAKGAGRFAFSRKKAPSQVRTDPWVVEATRSACRGCIIDHAVCSKYGSRDARCQVDPCGRPSRYYYPPTADVNLPRNA